MELTDKIYVAGHSGMVGRAVWRCLKDAGYNNIIAAYHDELNLTDQYQVTRFFRKHMPDYVINCAAKVGGILTNDSLPAQFIYDNLAIETNIIHESYMCGVKKLINLGSSCIYPNDLIREIVEEDLNRGRLEETNKAYAIAKIAGIEMCKAYNKQYGTKYITLMPCNLYGPYDNFDSNTSHVFPALIKKVYEAMMTGAKDITLWGNGSAMREFMFVDDLANIILYVLNHDMKYDIYNVGYGLDCSINDLARMIIEHAGIDCAIKYDATKPNGTYRKIMDSTRLWSEFNTIPITIRDLKDGIKLTWQWYLNNHGGDIF